MKWFCRTTTGLQLCKTTAARKVSDRHYPCPLCCGYTTLARARQLQQAIAQRRLVLGATA
jgi:hypothetical protein